MIILNRFQYTAVGSCTHLCVQLPTVDGQRLRLSVAAIEADTRQQGAAACMCCASPCCMALLLHRLTKCNGRMGADVPWSVLGDKIRHSSSGGRSTNLTLQHPPTRLQAGQLVAFSYMSAYEIWQSPQSQFQFKLLNFQCCYLIWPVVMKSNLAEIQSCVRCMRCVANSLCK